jgi:putative ABC transport system permease protein
MKVHEIRAAWRRLLARRTYSLLSLLILGVGLGAVIFVLGMINGLILEPLPFPDAGRLVTIGYEREKNVGIGEVDSADYRRLQPELASYAGIGIYAETSFSVVRAQRARRHAGALLSAPMFSMLGVQPLRGRLFGVAEDEPGAALAVVIGENLWRTEFGAAEDVLGQTIKVDGEMATIVGVMPKAFAFPYVSELWVPARLGAGDSGEIVVVGLLRPGTDLAQARLELDAVTARIGGSLASVRADRRLIVKPLQIRFVDEKTRAYLWLMFAASAVVLLLACVNVSNLQLTQTLKRNQELAIRTALGADRVRLLREQLAESLLLSIFATLVALLIGHLAAHWLTAVFTANDQAPPYFVSMGVDLRMLGFALLAALVTTMVAGLVPALRASRTDVNSVLRDGDKSATGTMFARLSVILVVAQVAFTAVLLVGAGTLVRGLERMLDMDLGTQTDASRVLTARLSLPEERVADAAGRVRFFEQLGERLRADPGVAAASVTTAIPGAQLGSHEFIGAYGAARPERGYRRAQLGIVDDGFIETFALKLTQGRFFDARDTLQTEAVAVVDEAMADALWPGRDPLGQKFAVNPDAQHPDLFVVVGVLSELHMEGPLDPALPSFVVSMRQFPQRAASIAITTRAAPLAFGPRLAEIVRTLDTDTPVYLVRTQQQAINAKRLSAVVLTQVFTAIGAIALLLAAAGLYGVLAFAVEQRTREIGVRRALGAEAGAIVMTVGRPIFLRVAAGLIGGLLIGIPWSNLLADPALHTRGNDPSVFLTVLVTVALVSALAALVPLVRAFRVDPVVALRHD